MANTRKRAKRRPKVVKIRRKRAEMRPKMAERRPKMVKTRRKMDKMRNATWGRYQLRLIYIYIHIWRGILSRTRPT